MRCPICKKTVDEASQGRPGSAYPFCGERCKLIDLGRWLDGKYQIPVAGEEAGDGGDQESGDRGTGAGGDGEADF